MCGNSPQQRGFTDAHVSVLLSERCATLRVLRLRCASLTEDGVLALRSCRLLTELRISHCPARLLGPLPSLLPHLPLLHTLEAAHMIFGTSEPRLTCPADIALSAEDHPRLVDALLRTRSPHAALRVLDISHNVAETSLWVLGTSPLPLFASSAWVP